MKHSIMTILIACSIALFNIHILKAPIIDQIVHFDNQQYEQHMANFKQSSVDVSFSTEKMQTNPQSSIAHFTTPTHYSGITNDDVTVVLLGLDEKKTVLGLVSYQMVAYNNGLFHMAAQKFGWEGDNYASINMFCTPHSLEKPMASAVQKELLDAVVGECKYNNFSYIVGHSRPQDKLGNLFSHAGFTIVANSGGRVKYQYTFQENKQTKLKSD